MVIRLTLHSRTASALSSLCVGIALFAARHRLDRLGSPDGKKKLSSRCNYCHLTATLLCCRGLLRSGSGSEKRRFTRHYSVYLRTDEIFRLSRSEKKQEAQLMLTTGSTRLAVSRGQQIWYHSTCNI